MKITPRPLFLLPVMILLLTGCRSGSQLEAAPTQIPPAATSQPIEETQASSVDVPSQDATPYPAPTQYVYTSPTPASYPDPGAGVAGFTPQPLVVPSPSEDKGVVVGQMIDANTGEPMAYVYVYLGTKIPLTPGPGYTYGLQEISSPHNQTNDQGQFAIGDVEPGSYLVMVFTPRSVSVVMQPNSDKELEVNVAAGDTIELGELQAVPPVY